MVLVSQLLNVFYVVLLKCQIVATDYHVFYVVLARIKGFTPTISGGVVINAFKNIYLLHMLHHVYGHLQLWPEQYFSLLLEYTLCQRFQMLPCWMHLLLSVIIIIYLRNNKKNPKEQAYVWYLYNIEFTRSSWIFKLTLIQSWMSLCVATRCNANTKMLSMGIG